MKRLFRLSPRLPLVLALLLIAVVPIYGRFTHGRLAMYPGWIWLLPGLFAQAGIAEETLFRGFLFRRFREGRTFGQAVVLSSVPYVLGESEPADLPLGGDPGRATT